MVTSGLDVTLTISHITLYNVKILKITLNASYKHFETFFKVGTYFDVLKFTGKIIRVT